MKEETKITPLGGVGQIGSNCTLIQNKGENILIDCGILFPYEDFFDLNYLIPDLSSIDFKVNTIIITHGHEDHIGAIHHYIEKFPEAKIYAPLFAKKLIEAKLEFKKISKKIILFTDPISVADIRISPLHVNHSIPDTKGLMITNDKTDTAMLFISDFKVDKTTPYEKPFDFKSVEGLKANYSRRLAFLDSTNIMSKNRRTPSESELYDNLKKSIESTTGTTYITSFASNIHRVQTILNIAKELNRVVIPYGRSMLRYMATATEIGELDDYGVVKDADDQSIKRSKIVLLSGSQGEHRGTVRRVVTRQDKKFKLKPEDKVIFSSKAIPGNEKKLSLLYNTIIEQGAQLLTSNELLIHASGHPGKDDLKEVYEAFSPTHAFPIHGESLFLKEHISFINKYSLSKEATMILNGDSITIGKNISVSQVKDPKEPVIFHGSDILIEKERLSERRKMATLGTVIVSCSKESTHKIRPNIEISTLGLPVKADSDIDDFKSYLTDIMRDNKGRPISDTSEKVRIATRRFFNERLGYRPLAIVHIC